MMLTIVRLFAAALSMVGFLSLATPASADEDTQAWLAANATIDVDANHFIWLEAQSRFTDDAERFGQLLVRPGIGVRFNPTTTGMIGYTYFENRPSGRASRYEHRVFEQFNARLAGGPGRVTVTSRTRFEQRYVVGFDDVGLRLRQQVRLQVPISARTSFVAWTEPFVSFNRTDWGQRQSIDQWRNFVGLNVPIDRRITIEPGIMHQYVNPTGANKRYNLVGSITLSGRF